MEEQVSLRSTIFQRSFLSVIIIISNVLSWYFPVYIFFQKILEEFQTQSNLLPAIFGIQFAAAIVFAVVGNIVAKKFSSRDTFLAFWMANGVIATLLIITLNTFNIVSIFVVSFLLGFSFGLGLPLCFAYFGDNTTIENRGLLAGVVFFVSGLCILFMGLIANVFIITAGAVALALWRGIGLLLFLITRIKKDTAEERPIEVKYRTVLFDRKILLYLIPWTMFAMINFLETPITHHVFGEELVTFIPLAEFGIGAFVALLAGKFADSVGRKRVIIFGFIMLGIGYASLGFFQGEPFFQYMYIIIDGVAWGIFFTMFFLVIWSELAENRTKEKYYLIGLIPFLIGSYSLILVTPFVQKIEVSAAFSLASFFLFIAVLPLLIAPETMPEKKMELKRLRNFADEAKKIREKYEKKSEKN